MTDKSVFTDDEWHTLTEAPLLVTAAIFLAGEHGPISMIKEASASARGDRDAGRARGRERAHRRDRGRGEHQGGTRPS